jgi:hypothetical protein
MQETGFLYSSVPPWYLDPVSYRLAARESRGTYKFLAMPSV